MSEIKSASEFADFMAKLLYPGLRGGGLTILAGNSAVNEITQRDQHYEARIKQLEEALRFYANPETYKDQDNSCSSLECCTPSPYIPILEDNGDNAREALNMAGDSK